MWYHTSAMLLCIGVALAAGVAGRFLIKQSFVTSLLGGAIGLFVFCYDPLYANGELKFTSWLYIHISHGFAYWLKRLVGTNILPFGLCAIASLIGYIAAGKVAKLPPPDKPSPFQAGDIFGLVLCIVALSAPISPSDDLQDLTIGPLYLYGEVYGKIFSLSLLVLLILWALGKQSRNPVLCLLVILLMALIPRWIMHTYLSGRIFAPVSAYVLALGVFVLFVSVLNDQKSPWANSKLKSPLGGLAILAMLLLTFLPIQQWQGRNALQTLGADAFQSRPAEKLEALRVVINDPSQTFQLGEFDVNDDYYKKNPTLEKPESEDLATPALTTALLREKGILNPTEYFINIGTHPFNDLEDSPMFILIVDSYHRSKSIQKGIQALVPPSLKVYTQAPERRNLHNLHWLFRKYDEKR